ncbi:lipopolysaccharide biosynthesis protein [Cellulomonas fengjieae]|uniref:lipopolysaccharide biosynthesis protein n=1 Tax=Cellulomonas fengjieae TaxID=2819978 RepID=UPI001AAFF2CE|nr:oligosaccharide flippase family protein [Cellulomonas fengjieae]MBO3100541.1 oligosaccharide flippase family protein [Cellulomonas fengjieae]
MTTDLNRTASATRQVGSTAVAKVLVMGVTGVAGIVTSRLIIEHYGVDAFAQYGLLTALSSLLPFADLGIAAVLINVVASSANARTDPEVRRTITSALRILLVSASVIAGVSLLIGALGLWPTLLGDGLVPGDGSRAATLSMVVFALALPLAVGQRLLVASGQAAKATVISGLGSPIVLGVVALAVALTWSIGPYVAVVSYAANAVVAVVCLVVAARMLSPQVVAAAKDVPRLRSVRGVSVIHVAGPMLVQMVALPIAMQTDRLLLSHLAPTAELAQYNFGAQMFGLINATVGAAGVALWPIYARARANDQVRSPLRPTLVFGGAALGLGLLLWLVLPIATEVVTQGKITLTWPLVASFVLFVTFQALKFPSGMYMTDARGLRFQVLPILLMVPLNLALSWLLIAPLGAAGPVLGSTVAVLLCQVLPNAWYVRRDLGRRRLAAAAQLP